jgi:hypothetical protein
MKIENLQKSANLMPQVDRSIISLKIGDICPMTGIITTMKILKCLIARLPFCVEDQANNAERQKTIVRFED